MQCPVCSNVTLVISSREGIEIDHCPDCRGVWLDRGELDKIIDRSIPVGGRTESRDRDYDRDRDRDRDSDRGRKKKRRGSFLEDLFDFDFD